MKNQFNQERSLESYRTTKKHSGIYSASIITGLSIAAYVYLYKFDSFSETLLVRLTVLWFFPLVFGYYGFIAQWMQANYREKGFASPLELLLSVSKKFPLSLIRPVLNIIHLPLYVRNKSPMFMAISGSLIWSIWLLIFFEVIFPLL